MLREFEIRVLQELQEEASITGLAERLSRDRGEVSKTVSHLEEQGLVHTQRKGKEKLVSPSETKAVELLQKIRHTHSHIDFPDLISGKAIPLLYYLDEPHSVSELADKTGNYRNTVNRILKRLLNRGILQKQGVQYRLTDEFLTLQELAEELVHHQNRQTVSNHASSYTILWETLSEFLLQTSDEIEHEAFHETGPALFQRYGLPLMITGNRYYFYSQEKEITPEKLLCHTLLIENTTRYKTYCLLLIQIQGLHRDPTVDTARHYGLADTVEQLFDYLETQGGQKTRDLPSWEEFRSTASDYGVET